MKRRFVVLFSEVWANIRSSIGGGLLIIIPVGVTYAVGSFAFNFLDELLVPLTTPIEKASGVRFTGMGVLIALALVYIIGVVAKSSRTSRFLQPGLRLAEKVPLLGTIYVSAREATRLLSPKRAGRETRVVLLEFHFSKIGISDMRHIHLGGEYRTLTRLVYMCFIIYYIFI